MNGPSITDRDIVLTATVSGSKVSITGNGGADLPAHSGRHRFNFKLQQPTGLNVKFYSLDSKDNSSSCPPGQGQNSDQIEAVTMEHRPGEAAFTDKNNNPAKNGPMNVSYQWNFTCPTKQVEPFDPIIRNGGGG